MMKTATWLGRLASMRPVPDAGGVVLDLGWPQDDLAVGPGAAVGGPALQGGPALEGGTAGSASAKVPPGCLVPQRP
jgi:hypothetical protein